MNDDNKKTEKFAELGNYLIMFWIWNLPHLHVQWLCSSVAARTSDKNTLFLQI